MIRLIAPLCAALAIAAGAFGAHGASPQAAEWLKTGAFYQLIHAVAALVIMEKAPKPAGLFLVGSGIFAASLYLMALGLPRWLGAVTPVGGVLMITGWLWLAVSNRRL